MKRAVKPPYDAYAAPPPPPAVSASVTRQPPVGGCHTPSASAPTVTLTDGESDSAAGRLEFEKEPGAHRPAHVAFDADASAVLTSTPPEGHDTCPVSFVFPGHHAPAGQGVGAPAG